MKLHLRPDNNSYTAQFGEEVLRAQLDGGAGRYRKDVLHSSTSISVQWTLNAEQYEYFMAFYRTEAQRGALPFTIDLITKDDALEETEVHFIPGTVQLTGQKGLAYFVSAQLEMHNPIDAGEAAADAAIITAYNTAHG